MMMLLLALSLRVASAAPLLDFSVAATGRAYKSAGASEIFRETVASFVLAEQNAGGTAGVQRWFEAERELSPEYLLQGRLILFDEGYWRLDFQIVRYLHTPGRGTHFVPVCTASQLFADEAQMLLLKTVDLNCWAMQLDDAMNAKYSFDLTARAN